MLESEDDIFCLQHGVFISSVCPQCNCPFPQQKKQVQVCPVCGNVGLQEEFHTIDWKYMESN